MRHRSSIVIFMLLVAALSLSALKCSSPTTLSGTITQSGNGKVEGFLVLRSGVPAAGTLVHLRKSTFDPIACVASTTCSTYVVLTDSAGHYNFDTVPSDTYAIESYANSLGQRHLRTGVVVQNQKTTTLPIDTLKMPGILETALPESLMVAGGYVYVPGTGFAGMVDTIAASQGYIEIDSVPAGILPHLYFRYPLSMLIAVDTNEINIGEQDTTDFQFESDDTLDAVQ